MLYNDLAQTITWLWHHRDDRVDAHILWRQNKVCTAFANYDDTTPVAGATPWEHIMAHLTVDAGQHAGLVGEVTETEFWGWLVELRDLGLAEKETAA